MQHDKRLSPQRVAAVDVARGLAIIGVVLNHSVDGLTTAGVIHTGDALFEINRALYMFRMPALAFLLGVFIPRGWEKRGTKRYLLERLLAMTWLYFVWYLIQCFFDVVLAGAKNTPRTLESYFAFWSPPAHLWFLPYLVTATTIIVLLRVWAPKRMVFGLVSLAVLTIATWGWNPDIVGVRGISLIAFTALGAAIGMDRLRSLMSIHIMGWTLIGLASSFAFVGLLQQGVVNATTQSNVGLIARLASVVCAALGVLSLLAISVIVSKPRSLCRCVGYIGQRTIAIYLGHIIVVAGVRIVLLKVGVLEPLVIVPVAIIAGISLPIALYRLGPVTHTEWLFSTPRIVNNRLPAASSLGK